MLSKKFKPAKCKTSLKLAVARIKLLRNKREVQVKQLRRELAQLLESGQEQTARIRVEHVIREEKTMSAYELIELYCELIVARLPIIESQKSCPIDLKEAVASVIFASPRCADLPELLDIRKHFLAKYGKEFIGSALEVRPDSGVSRIVVEKLSARAPDVETKIKTLTAVAQEHNIKWDSEAFEEQLTKPQDDLLHGPNTFSSASKMMPMESSSMTSSPAPIQTDESRVQIPQNDAARSTTTFLAFSEANGRTGTSASFTSQSGSRQSESRSRGEEVNSSYSREGNTSLNHPSWNMEFQDATSAAQAAAESAERASMAARAAAELASRGNMPRQNSSESNESPTSSKKYERPEKLRAFLGEHVVDKPDSMGSGEIRNSRGMKTEVQHLHQAERPQTSSRREAERTSSDYSTARKPTSQSSRHSSQDFIYDEDINLHYDDLKDYSHGQRIPSESEAVESNRLNMKYGNAESSQENINVNSTKTASSDFVGDDERNWNSDIYKHENYGGEASRMDTREASVRSDHKQSTSSDSFAVVFDDYGSDAEDDNLHFGEKKGNMLDLYNGGESSSFQSNEGPFSIDQNRTGSFSKNTGAQLHLFKESEPDEHSKTTTEDMFPSRPAFDDSDGETMDSEDEVAKSVHHEAMKNGSSLHDHRPFMRGSVSDESAGTTDHFDLEAKEVEEKIRNFGVYDENIDTDSDDADKFYKRSGSGSLPNNQPPPSRNMSPRDSSISVEGPAYSSSDEEESQPLRLSKRQPPMENEANRRTTLQSSHLGSEIFEVSDELSNESEQGINFGRLTGGLKHKGFPRPPYVRSSAADVSLSLKQTSGSTSIHEKPIIPNVDNMQSASSEVPDQESHKLKSHPKAYASESRTSGASIDSHLETAEDVSSKSEITEAVDFPAQESYYPKSRSKGYEEKSSMFQERQGHPVSNEQNHYPVVTRHYRDSASVPPKQSVDAFPEIDKLTASVPKKTYASSEAINLDQYDQKSHTKANRESSSRRTHLDSETGGEASGNKMDPIYTSGSRIKLSRRTKEVPSESQSSFPEVTGAPFNTASESVTLQGRVSSKPVQTNPSGQQPSVAPKQIPSTFEESSKSNLGSSEDVAPRSSVNTRSSSLSGESVSRESSLNQASHVHPKLPDYESLAARFQSLRSNRR
ncbi:uncharacterized protein A4U43_C05F29100 [Asparagus officinalis]|uniref:IST1-like protein n=1 Tax=Asparagus officinalis TaxID=4686 RepID=A0A5P1EVX7_ASPOF|nr:uncharacterized protein LOC109840818 [Asparagus officinalis]ONK69994.1 uncharacterized protein A4U43_C05F29100 [Asparagus officinalis]